MGMAGRKSSSRRRRTRSPGRSTGRRPERGGRTPSGLVEARIQAWIDDPSSPWGLSERPVPDLAAGAFPFTITGPAVPVAIHEPGTPEFRHWNAADALRRTADVWAPLLSRHRVGRWQSAATLPVTLDAGHDLNAYYDRSRLAFFHWGRGKAAVHSGESPDVVCHEAGHAFLDALRPDLWDAPFIEIAAFHESFGDVTALLAALALPEVRGNVLTALVRGEASPLSRIAEQLGAALGRENPAAVEADCLRNAANEWRYVAPESLPASAPATELSAEPHAFSRVFTGAFHDLLSRSLQARSTKPSGDDLAAVAGHAARLLLDAVASAALTPAFFAEVAARMIDVDAASFDGIHRTLLAEIFVRRRILPKGALSARGKATRTAGRAATARGEAAGAAGSPRTVRLDGSRFGLSTAGILVDLPGSTGIRRGVAPPPRFPDEAATATMERSVDRFVDVLFENHRIELPARTRARGLAAAAPAAGGRATHALSRTDGHLRLSRVRFDGPGGASGVGRTERGRSTVSQVPVVAVAVPRGLPGTPAGGGAAPSFPA